MMLGHKICKGLYLRAPCLHPVVDEQKRARMCRENGTEKRVVEGMVLTTVREHATVIDAKRAEEKAS